MYRCIIAALSVCSQVIQFSSFLILARKKDVVALCDWEWLSCVEGSEEIKGLAYLYCSPPPCVTHFPPLQTPFTHTSSKRSNRLPVCPPTLPVFPIWEIVRNFPSKVPRTHENWIVEFPKGEPFDRNGMNGNKTSGKKILKSLVHLAWLSSSFINFRKFGLFDTGSCQKFKQEMLVEWNLPGGGRVEEWQGFFQVLEYHKIPKISPGAYIFQRPFLRGLFLEGLIFGRAYLRREIFVSKSIGLTV